MHCKVYCIIGGSEGLGLELVRQLAAVPENIVLATCYSTTPIIMRDLEDILSPNMHILHCNMNIDRSMSEFAAEAGKALNGRKIDFLINNAGTDYNHPAELLTALTMTPEEVYWNVRINVVGPAMITQFLLEAGLLSENVRVLNISSALASMQRSLAMRPRRCAPYSISKAGLNMLTVHLAHDLKEHLPGVVVVTMDPGWVKTDRGAQGAILEPEVSVSGILEVMHGLTSEDTSKFFAYDGSEVPW